jgi:tagatose 1,6-diphosphate aldolase
VNSFSIGNSKRERLSSLSTSDGVIAALAMDQRRSLRKMLAVAAGTTIEQISDAQLAEFKSAVTAGLTPHASAILLDPEYGLEASRVRAPGCGLLLSYESDGFENPRPHRMLALLPHASVHRLCTAGADGIKILLSYAPSGDGAANDEKHAWIERIGNECDALGVPFFLEPVVYDPAGASPNSLEFARAKPDWVIRTMREFSKDIYKVDVLKVEFPVSAAFVEGSAVFCGRAAYSLEQALECYRRADSVARRPYIYLSAGVSNQEFLESLRMAVESGARFSGVLCGRANWQDGVALYARHGRNALEEWLATTGVANIQSVNECLRAATPWRRWIVA